MTTPMGTRLRWPLLAVAVAIWPVAGVFTLSRAFVLRDLTLVFWPKYLWLRHTVWSGQWPWWDPYIAGGQSAAADALLQLFLLPTLALRLLLPEPIGFNLWVALPFPLAAWGAYVYFRRYASSAGAALGAVTFAVSGPVVSTGNFPNLSWSVLFLPWLLWAVDRWSDQPTPRRLAIVALLVGVQGCAGEPVTWIATAGLIAVYVLFGIASPHGDLRRAVTRTVLIGMALALGAALAAVQLMPLWAATQRSARVAHITDGFWSVHPLGLLEAVAPTMFGNFFVSFSAYQPWMTTLNSGRDPFFYSLYVGMAVLLLALVGSIASRRERRTPFWVAVAILALIGALGPHTPIYPWLQTWVPLLGTFRYPAKYLVFVCFALAALVVDGWSALERQRTAEEDTSVTPGVRVARRTMAVVGVWVAVIAYAIATMTYVWPLPLARWIFRLAVAVGLANPFDGVGVMMPELPAHAARLMLLAVMATGLLWLALSTRREARRARWVLYACILVDLAVTNGPVNPTADIALMRPPDWVEVARRAPHERFYFGGRLQGGMQATDPDSPGNLQLPPVNSLLEMRVIMSTRAQITPSGAGLREMMSFDLTSTFPTAYTRLLELFAEAPRADRLRMLRRAGVRYCVMREPLPDGAAVLARIPQFVDAGLFECDPNATRVIMIGPGDARLEPDLARQAERMFGAHEPEPLFMLRAEPPAAVGTPGAPVAPYATFLRDDPTAIDVEAGAGAGGGFLLLRDSYDPFWQVTVDGQPAELLRANLLFRAVRLTEGRHTVRFAYVPTALHRGAWVSSVAGVVLIGLIGVRPRRRAVPEAGPESTVLRSSDNPVMGVDAPHAPSQAAGPS